MITTILGLNHGQLDALRAYEGLMRFVQKTEQWAAPISATSSFHTTLDALIDDAIRMTKDPDTKAFFRSAAQLVTKLSSVAPPQPPPDEQMG